MLCYLPSLDQKLSRYFLHVIYKFVKTLAGLSICSLSHILLGPHEEKQVSEWLDPHWDDQDTEDLCLTPSGNVA